MSDPHVVQIIVLEPINPDRTHTTSEDPDGPFINSELLEQVDTGIFGPFDTDEAAEQFVLDRQEMQKSHPYEKVRYRIIPLTAPPIRN